MKIYSLRKSRHILRHIFHVFQKKKKKLTPENKQIMRDALLALQDEVMQKNRAQANERAKEAQHLSHIHLKKTSFDHVKELVIALCFALIVAVLVRQMWFEFYEIPSGSMRPTFKEQDRLVVSKTAFGINIPLQPAEFYFDPSLVKRNGIVIFTGENMDIRDVDTMYFYLFPGKKQYIKRMIGKPGDVLYFYGGKIYGIDKDGQDISPSLQLEQLDLIEHIPFIDFDRKLVLPLHPINGIFSPVYIYQMNEPVVKLTATSSHQLNGEMMPLKSVHAPDAGVIKNYADLWGFKNYGMASLLTYDQVRTLTDQNPASLEKGQLYLEIRHHPSLSAVKLIRDEMGRLRPSIGLSTSIIPLQESHLRELFQHMYTARFDVLDGKAYRTGMDKKTVSVSPYLPELADVPNGCYEFYHGKAYEILWQGITKELPFSHPIYRFSAERIQLFFNLGIEWDTRFSPQVKNQRLNPSRYTYFYDGSLYLLVAPILPCGDDTLSHFVDRECAREQSSSMQAPYAPFVDFGPPAKDGVLDVDFVRQYGIMIPEKMYLVLGDNHAMSADSRDFGFVPEQNLRGAPDFIFWPPGHRFGAPNQPAYAFINTPRAIVWALAALFISVSVVYWRRKNGLPLKKLEKED